MHDIERREPSWITWRRIKAVVYTA